MSRLAPHHPRPRLRHLLRRALMTLALTSVGVVGLALAIPAIVTLHAYSAHDVALVGRAISHTVEAAVVFGDAEATQEALTSIVQTEDVLEATVIARDGRELARWRDGGTGWQAELGATAARLLQDGPAILPILHDGAVVGQIEVLAGGRTLLRFLALGAAGIVACQALIVLGALYLSRRILGRILDPLAALAEVTGSVQRERAFSRRVPPLRIVELDELGTAFNGLLIELESWQVQMEGEHRRLSHQATHDSLTGLPNRAYFEGRLNRGLEDAKRSRGSVGVMLIDCNRFKEINDKHGHAAGDAVLVGISARLRGHVREHDLVARLGGDEFAVLIAPFHDGMDLQALAAAMVLSMQMPIQVRDGLALLGSISIGAAVYPDDATTAQTLLHHADEAMYRAKRAEATSRR